MRWVLAQGCRMAATCRTERAEMKATSTRCRWLQTCTRGRCTRARCQAGLGRRLCRSPATWPLSLEELSHIRYDGSRATSSLRVCATPNLGRYAHLRAKSPTNALCHPSPQQQLPMGFAQPRMLILEKEGRSPPERHLAVVPVQRTCGRKRRSTRMVVRELLRGGDA